MDPIADMLTTIRNAQMNNLPSVVVPASKIKAAILAILKQEGYVEDFALVEDTKPQLKITLRYRQRQPAIAHIRRISKPGLRKYTKRATIPRPLQGIGVAILSTPVGVISDKEARKKGVGGEIICEVW